MDNQLTPCEVAAAMTCWHMAIQAKLNNDLPETSLEELAMHYALHTSTQENMEATSHFFNWEYIMGFINEQ